MILEVCVDSVESALAAERGGATRIELCSELAHGGTTPSAGVMKSVRDKVSIGVHMMIRPRPGDFVFSIHEFDAMKRDVEIAKDLGADGVVIGILTSEGEIDIGKVRSLVDLARPLPVTFHRAFDKCANLPQSLDCLKSVGMNRVLTAGGKRDIRENIDALADLVARAGSSLNIMAGGGITFDNVSEIVRQTRVEEVHTLSAVSSAISRNHLQSDRFTVPHWLVDESKVRAMVDRLWDLSSNSQR